MNYVKHVSERAIHVPSALTVDYAKVKITEKPPVLIIDGLERFIGSRDLGMLIPMTPQVDDYEWPLEHVPV